MQVSITKTKLKVGLKGADPVLDGDLFASVKPDDCYWNITDGKVVELTLQKVGIVYFLAILSSSMLTLLRLILLRTLSMPAN